MVMPCRAFQAMPTELIEAAAGYMDDADLLSFRLTCKHADAKTLRVIGKRFFSTLKTTLMASDLEKLDGVSRSARLAEYVRAIRIQDDQQKVAFSLPWRKQECLDPGELARLLATHRVWPRETVGVLGVNRTAVAKLKAILKERLFSLDALSIHYYYNVGGTEDCDEVEKEDTEATIALAQDIISGGKLATTSFQVYRSCPEDYWLGAALTLYLDRDRQGEALGFGLLREVGLKLASSGPSSDHLLTQIFHCAPMLEDLRLEYSGRTDAQLVELLHQGNYLPKLKNLYFSHSGDPTVFVKGALSNSQNSLTRIGLRRISLDSRSRAEDFMREILDGYPQWKTWQVGHSCRPWSEDERYYDSYEVAMRDPPACSYPAHIDVRTKQHIHVYSLKSL